MSRVFSISPVMTFGARLRARLGDLASAMVLIASFALALAAAPAMAQQEQSGNWTGGTYAYANGLTATFSGGGWSDDNFNSNGNSSGNIWWSNNGSTAFPLQGDLSVKRLWSWNQCATLTYTGGYATSPILHFDRIGGGSGSLANSARVTLSGTTVTGTPLTWTKLSGTQDFDFTSTTVEDIDARLARGYNTAQSSWGTTNGTASGSVRIDGVISSFQLCFYQVGPAGSGDEIEFILFSEKAPGVSVEKTVEVADPDGFAIPGADVIYTLKVTNSGAAVDASTIVATDPIPGDLTFFRGAFDGTTTEPVKFINGAPSSGLTCCTSAHISYSTNGGASYSYLPPAGYDAAITHLRVIPGGVMNGAGAGSPSFELKFRAQIK